MVRQNFSNASNILPMGHWKRVVYFQVVVSSNGELDFRFCEKNLNIFLLYTSLLNSVEKIMDKNFVVFWNILDLCQKTVHKVNWCILCQKTAGIKKNLNIMGNMYHVDGKYFSSVSKVPQNFTQASDLCFNC